MNAAVPSERASGRAPVLVVEDNFLIGMMIVGLVRRLGFNPHGPVPSVDEAVHAAKTLELSGAVLDINIRGGTSEGVALALEARGVPFFFVTGYSSPLLISERLKTTLRLSKPVSEIEFRRAVDLSFSESGPQSA